MASIVAYEAVGNQISIQMSLQFKSLQRNRCFLLYNKFLLDRHLDHPGPEKNRGVKSTKSRQSGPVMWPLYVTKTGYARS